MKSRKRSIRRALLGLLAVSALFAFAGVAPAAAASARWELNAVPQPTNFMPVDSSGADVYFIVATNVGNAPTDGTKATFTDHLPPGLTATKIEFYPFNLGWGDYGKGGSAFAGDHGSTLCSTVSVRCVYPGSTGLPPLAPGEELLITVHVATHPGAPETLVNTVTATGGGAPETSLATTSHLSSAPAPFGVEFAVSNLTSEGVPATQAGAHPYSLTTSFAYSTEHPGGPSFFLLPRENAKSNIVDLPAGFIGNPQATPRCQLSQAAELRCPPASQVGTAVLQIENLGRTMYGVFNLEPQTGYAAELVLLPPEPAGTAPTLTAGVRTGGDYGVEIKLSGGVPAIGLIHVSVTVWGSPSDSVHDLWRERKCGNIGCYGGGVPSGVANPRPYLTNPTSCSSSPLSIGASADSWEHPGLFVSAGQPIAAMTGCNQVPFSPAIKARPTTNVADAPSGLEFDLEVPQNENPEGIAEAHVRDVTVTLPKGVAVNPASANGLDACTEAQADLSSEGPSNCPDASKLGTVSVKTPLLDHPLPGAVYLAKPYENPFGSLLALYIAIHDPQSGVIVKLPGKVTSDPQTGQLTTTFEQNPQLPFDDFHLHFFGGAVGALRTPATCGAYQVASDLTPWTAPEGKDVHAGDSFEVVTGPNGAATCPRQASEQENKPRFRAGTEAPQAGAFSPFGFKLARDDGSQEVTGVDTVLPPGLTGKLAGIPYCSQAQIAAAAQQSGEAEKANPSCPAASEVGIVNIGSGAGPDPYYVQGHAYLAGAYKGAPLSLAVVTPAVAGPFDLGTVVVRVALFVDRETAQIHAVSDEIPHILQGIPLDVRSIALKLSRPQFSLNPTSCNELGFSGTAFTLTGATAPLSQRFQVGGCNALGFKPKLTLRLKGGTKRSDFPALKAVLTMPPGGANIARAQVALPHAEFLAQGHINTVCTQPQLAAASCPPGSVYGHARAISPLLDKPLEGPVYLGVGYGHKLPDLVADLNGQIRILLHGKVDTDSEDGLRNTFEVVPDAPVTKFVLEMKGGKKGLLENHENLCRKAFYAKASFTAQSGKLAQLEPKLQVKCPKRKKAKRGRRDVHRRRTR